MEHILSRTTVRLSTAQAILAELQLIERWKKFGNPIVVGAVAYDLVVAPDIDMEIFCEAPSIEDGFEMLQSCALHPRVRKARFANELHGPDQGLYWQLRYLTEDEQIWKIDMWSLSYDHPGPYAAALVDPMRQALTDETRQAILLIKEQVLLDPTIQCGSINIYRAVLDDGVRDVEQYRMWLEHHQASGLLTWKPTTKTMLSNLPPRKGS